MSEIYLALVAKFLKLHLQPLLVVESHLEVMTPLVVFSKTLVQMPQLVLPEFVVCCTFGKMDFQLMKDLSTVMMTQRMPTL
jgi:hypothetical protein